MLRITRNGLGGISLNPFVIFTSLEEQCPARGGLKAYLLLVDRLQETTLSKFFLTKPSLPWWIALCANFGRNCPPTFSACRVSKKITSVTKSQYFNGNGEVEKHQSKDTKFQIDSSKGIQLWTFFRCRGLTHLFIC